MYESITISKKFNYLTTIKKEDKSVPASTWGARPSASGGTWRRPWRSGTSRSCLFNQNQKIRIGDDFFSESSSRLQVLILSTGMLKLWNTKLHFFRHCQTGCVAVNCLAFRRRSRLDTLQLEFTMENTSKTSLFQVRQHMLWGGSAAGKKRGTFRSGSTFHRPSRRTSYRAPGRSCTPWSGTGPSSPPSWWKPRCSGSKYVLGNLSREFKF